ncbi:hypothetical protein ABB07_01910 [Streptomyces incarnatus]|uniref:Flavin reductase like domain-containing protein n=1 Tax=Streptomyces incarnatus TaxID=665007 RepID=A0ABN4G579_9ACTN|nr:flavin reductase family protein [Streptomyces incarnatus]AKJ08830.1 hypothetical protein ABB07_01910 [Streptomyces incarnatus]
MPGSPVRYDAVAPEDFRAALGRFASGVVAVSGLAERDRPAGFAASSFTSVSLEPPLVAFCPARSSRTWPLLRATGRVAVSVLRAGQEDVSRRLATRDDDKFTAIAWSPSASGLPLIDGALAWLECTVTAEHQAGDHHIVIARVDRLATAPDTNGHAHEGPLIHYRGDYRRFA